MFIFNYWGLAALIGLFLMPPQSALAHGTEGSIEKGGLVVLAKYASGEVMSYAKVTITSPASEKPFQTGRTDFNGKFAFVPDVPGKWRFVADDEMGHRLSLMIEVDEYILAGRSSPLLQPSSGSKDMIAKVFFGVALLMLAASLMFWWQGKKVTQKVIGPETDKKRSSE